MNCIHGRPNGVFCPHCIKGVNLTGSPFTRHTLPPVPADIRERAMKLFRPPFTFDALGGYIWDANGNMVADEGGHRIRGWGYINNGRPDAAALQDEMGKIVAEALNAFWSRKPRMCNCYGSEHDLGSGGCEYDNHHCDRCHEMQVCGMKDCREEFEK